MSRERHLLDTIGAVCGWNTNSKYELLLQYVENQDSPDALEDFLKEAAQQELEPLEDEPDEDYETLDDQEEAFWNDYLGVL